MSDEIRANISAMAKALCYYPSGPSNVNSCCPGIGRCEMDAAIAEIARLRAELATARREGMDEVLRIIADFSAAFSRPECCGNGLGGYTSPPECCGNPLYLVDVVELQNAIRAAAKEAKP